MGDFWQKTIEVYQNFITFPEITEKYLKRPPFKYLFQIFLSVNKKTNFAPDLLSAEEQDPEYYNTPERKMNFLKKLIAHVYGRIGKTPPLRPLSVIKGEECDKTNEFLRDLFAVATGPSAPPPERQPTKQSKQSLSEKSGPGEKPALEKVAPVSRVSIEKSAKPTNEVQIKPPIEARKNSAKKVSIVDQLPKEKENGSRALDPTPSERPQEKPQSGAKAIGQEIIKNIEKDDKIIAKTDEPKAIKMSRIADKKGDQSSDLNVDLSIEELRSTIQKVTQNTNPLGKLIDYAEDDLGNMNKEYKNWMRMYHEATSKLEKLEGELDDELQSYTDKIQQLDEQILDYQEKIAGQKGKIFKTEQKISTLLQKFVD